MLIVAWVTLGFVAPGVQPRSGSPFAAMHEFGGGTVPVGPGASAAAVVGVTIGVVCEEIEGAGTAADSQLTAKEVTKIRLTTRDRGERPFKPQPFPQRGYSVCIPIK